MHVLIFCLFCYIIIFRVFVYLYVQPSARTTEQVTSARNLVLHVGESGAGSFILKNYFRKSIFGLELVWMS